MTNRQKTQTIHQYEPLVMPEGWKDDERRFALKLSELLDLLFHRQGVLARRLDALEKGERNHE